MSNSLFSRVVQKLNFSFTRKVPQILQVESSECGLACLAMVCSYHGLDIDMLNLRHQFAVSTHGATLKTVTQTASAVGLKNRSLSLDLDEVKELKLPCVLHWDMNHFVVLVACRRASFVIHDPAMGKRIIGQKELSEHFTGVAVEFWPSSQFEKRTLKTRIKLLDLMSNVTGLKGALLKIGCLSVVMEAINLLLPVGMQLVTDHVIQARDHSLLTVICSGLLFFMLFRAFVGTIRGWVSLVMGTLIDVQWKNSLFDHLIKLPLAFFEKRHLGDIQSRFTNNAREGVREMRRGLSNYEKYLKSGLINTDQLNNQRYMFYQQQTSYQSLNSQAIQETLQISQLRSQILTRAGEFDNNITQNEYQRNELERSLIESDAGGNIIIPAQSSGRLESLSVTPGQMVNVGSSLAQIQPLSNSKYYLVLWLPNNSLPYVKVNDGVNIRYDAFPSEKFGQFPGRIKSISYIPASKEEMSGYSSAPQNGNGVVENYYKVLVELKSAEVSDKGKEMHLSGGLKARTIVFLDTRKLYQWMFMPFYDIKNSVAGPVNE